MTIDQFKEKLTTLLTELDDFENLTITLAIIDDRMGSLDVMGTGCIVCASDMLAAFVEVKEIPHLDEQDDKQDEKVH